MWKTVSLSDVCNVSIGKTPPRGDKLYWDEEKITNNVWLSIADLSSSNDKYISDSKEYLSNEGASLFKSVPKNTLIMSFKLSIGKLAFTKCELRTNEAIAALSILDESLVLKEFLYYYLSSLNWDVLAGHNQKVKGKTLNKKKLNALEITLPPLSEQQRIVAKLDAAFAEIDEAVENANTKEFEINKLQASILSASLSTNAIKSELNPITELCNDIYAGGDAPAKVNISKVKTKKYKTPIYSNGVKDSGLYGYTTFEPRTLQPAITISARGTIGHIEVRNKPFLPIVRLIVLEPKIEKIDLNFLKFALLSMKIFSSGSSIPQLTIPMLKKMNLSLPPLAEQKQIVKKLNTAYREFENISIFIEKSRQSYKSLKSAILAQELQSSQGKVA